jgi:YVTN family beta-propeller protein
MPELAPGTVFAGHRIEGVAGRGGMGVVYRATHLALDHAVALKVISPELARDQVFRRRFETESRAAVSIRHPNVVQVHHAGEEDGLLFVTMDLIEGFDLRDVMNREGRVEPARTVAIVGQVASALDAAHRRGLVHRDIKPGNILIERTDGAEHAYLTDFGLTKRIEASTDITASGGFVGSLDYVAPEQIRGERVDARTDVYALGCVLYEALAGRVPFAEQEEKVAKIYAHLQRPPRPLSEVAPGLPPELDEVVSRALEKDPERRFPSAGDLARAADAALTGMPVSQPERSVGTGSAAPAAAADAAEAPTLAISAEAPSRRRRLLLLIGAIVALAAAAAVVAILVVEDGEDGAGPDGAGSAADRPARVVGEPIPVGEAPVQVAADADGVWVGSLGENALYRIDPAGGRATREAALGEPEGIALGFGSVWVASRATGDLLRIDPDTGRTVARIAVGLNPGGVLVGRDHVWVAVGGADEVVRIDPRSNRELARVAVGHAPYGVAADSGLWVTNRDGNSVSLVRPQGEIQQLTIAVGADPKGIVVDFGRVWVANAGDDTVTTIDVDSREVRRTIRVGNKPRGIASGFGSIWVANGGDRSVSRIDPETGKVVQELEVGRRPQGIATGAGSVWVANGGDGTVSRIER